MRQRALLSISYHLLMKSSIQTRVARILQRHFLVRPHHFEPTQRLEQDYNLSRLDKLELALCLEQTFHFDFQDQEIAEFRTLGNVVASVKRHLKPATAPHVPRLRPAYERATALLRGATDVVEHKWPAVSGHDGRAAEQPQTILQPIDGGPVAAGMPAF